MNDRDNNRSIKLCHATWCNGNTFSSCERVSGPIPLVATIINSLYYDIES